jgi:autotransporter family porin
VAGEPFTLKYKLGNKGPNTAQNVVINIQLPEGLNYVGAQVDTGSVSYNANNRMLTWILDSVPMGDPYLNLTVISPVGGSFTIKPVIRSGTFNSNLDPTGIFSFSVQGNGSKGTVVNAASTTRTVPLKSTGTPVNYLVLAVLMVVSGLIAPKIKK